MRWFLLALCGVFLSTTSRSQVVLNEVYYDAPGSDDGWEFVELVNAGDEAVLLFGCAIEFHDGASSGWVRLWAANVSDTISAGGLFVIGGERVIPAADAYDPLGLQNGPDAVRLVRDGHELDLLGYGALDDPRFFEGSPAPDVTAGSSLARRLDGVDTGNNAADFEPAAPSPGRRNVARLDVALRISENTPSRDARLSAGAERFAFVVVALGVEAIEPGTVRVTFADSTQSGLRAAHSREVSAALSPGDSAEVEFEVDLCEGYHWIVVQAVCRGDGRAENDFVRLFRRVGAPPLLISEVMSHPREDCPEYVELFNTGETPYDLAGHWFRDASRGPSSIVESERTIPPRGFIVLTADAGGLAACFPSLRGDAIVEVEGTWPSLNHTGSGGEADSIVILDAALVPVDRVAYPPQPSGTRGRSLERVDLFPNEGPHTWVLSAADAGGTPGELSLDSRLAPDAARTVAVSPNPFDPWRQEILVAVVPRRNDTERVVVSVFDLDGYRVADLGSASALPSTFIWNGRDAAGASVLPGLYLLACEFFSLTTGSRRVERVVVGCGRRTGPRGIR